MMLVQSWAASLIPTKDPALPHVQASAPLPFAPSLQGNRIGQSGAKMISDAIRTNSPDCVVDV